MQSSAWSLKVASTLAEREPVKVRTPLSGEYGLHMKRLPLACLSPRLYRITGSARSTRRHVGSQRPVVGVRLSSSQLAAHTRRGLRG